MQQDSSKQIGGVPAQRTEAPPPPVRTEADTVILPAFVTGRKERPPKPAEPVRHQATPEGKLPAGELAGLYIDSFERVWETATPVDGA